MSLICLICQENLINNESLDTYVNKCGHVYHSNCILPWWDRTAEPTCPQCREPCNIDTITKIYLTLDDTPTVTDATKSTARPIDDPKTETLLRHIKEHIDLQTYNQTKDLNDKFRQQNSEFSTMLLNNITRLRSNYDDKLSAVSKELSTAISAALDPHERPDPESFTLAGEHSSTSKLKRQRRGRFTHPVAGVLCLISVVTLIVVIVYSHLILNALHTNANSGSLNIYNISQRLEQLNVEMQEIAANVSRDNRNIRLTLDSIGKTMGSGVKSPDILKRFDEVKNRGDQLLLEQIQTDRRINLKLEVLENSINILKTHLEAGKQSKSQTKFYDEKQSELEEQNRRLEEKLLHLKTILDKNANATANQLRQEIENDSQLAHGTDEPKSIREEAVELWNKLIHSDSSKSSSCCGSVGKRLFVVASFASTFLFQKINKLI